MSGAHDFWISEEEGAISGPFAKKSLLLLCVTFIPVLVIMLLVHNNQGKNGEKIIVSMWFRINAYRL